MIRWIYAKVFFGFTKVFSKKNFKKYLFEFSYTYVPKKAKTILSFGSGGEIKRLLKDELNLTVKELDVDPKRNPDLIQDIQNMKDVKSNSVDAIYCLEVLEHVKNPFKGVSEMKRVLKKEGIIIASTPFTFPIHDEPYDFFRYTKYGIQELFKDFKLLELRERNSYFESVYVLMIRTMVTGSILNRLIGILLLPIYILLLPLILILSLLVRNKQATTGYLYVAQKK